MDNGSQHALMLVRLSQGGYIVQDAYTAGSGLLNMQHFAHDDIDVALKFMRDKIAPIPPQQEAAPEATSLTNFSIKVPTYDKHYDSQGYCDNPGRGY